MLIVLNGTEEMRDEECVLNTGDIDEADWWRDTLRASLTEYFREKGIGIHGRLDHDVRHVPLWHLADIELNFGELLDQIHPDILHFDMLIYDIIYDSGLVYICCD